MKKFLTSLVKTSVVKHKEEFVAKNSKENKISELLKLEIPTYEFREFEYKNKIVKLIKSAFIWFKIINKNLLDVEYEIFDNGEYIENYRYSPTYVRKFAVKGEVRIYRESGKLEFNNEFRFSIKIPRIVNKYYFIINGTKYIPSLHFSIRPVIYFPTKILFSTLGLILSLDTKQIINLFSEKYSHLTSIYVIAALYNPFRSDEAYNNFVEYLHMLLPFEGYKIYVYNYKKDLYSFYQEMDNELSRYKDKFAKIYRMFIPDLNYDPKKEFERFLDDVLTTLFLKHPYNRALLAADLGPDYIKQINSFSQIIRDIIDRKILTFDFTNDMNYGKLYNRRISIYEPLFSLLNREILSYIFSVINTTTHKSFSINERFFERALFSKRPFNLNLYDIATPYDAMLGHKFINFDGDEDKTLLEYRIPNETYLGRVCLVSTSSQKPGIDMHITPNNVKFNYFGYIADLYKPRFQEI